LISDVVSSNKKTIYGKSGDEVRIIAVHHPAVVVENKKGCRYATCLSNLK
jgi:hypothetical protein